MTKKLISKYATSLSRYDFDGETLAEIHDKFAELIGLYGGGSTLDISTCIDGDLEISVTSYREETDEEYAQRTIREALAQTAQERRERAQLAALVAKYGNS